MHFYSGCDGVRDWYGNEAAAKLKTGDQLFPQPHLLLNGWKYKKPFPLKLVLSAWPSSRAATRQSPKRLQQIDLILFYQRDTLLTKKKALRNNIWYYLNGESYLAAKKRFFVVIVYIRLSLVMTIHICVCLDKVFIKLGASIKVCSWKVFCPWCVSCE